MNLADHYLEKPYGALMLDELEDYQEIIEGFTECIQNNRSVGVAYHNRALAYWEIGEVDNALHDFTEAEKALPKSHLPSQIKGMLLQKMGRLDQATASMDRAAALSPRDATVHRARALLLLEANKPELALVDLDHAIKLEPTFQPTLQDRQKVLALLNRTGIERARKRWWQIWRK